MAGVLAALEQLAVPGARVHTEQFGWSGALPVATPSAVAEDAGADLAPVVIAAPGPKHGRRASGTRRAR